MPSCIRHPPPTTKLHESRPAPTSKISRPIYHASFIKGHVSQNAAPMYRSSIVNRQSSIIKFRIKRHSGSLIINHHVEFQHRNMPSNPSYMHQRIHQHQVHKSTSFHTIRSSYLRGSGGCCIWFRPNRVEDTGCG
jgi:hypothetical protein